MLDMRNEITRGSGQISMSEVRTRYGGSGQISFSDLRKCEGFTVNPANYYSPSKFFTADFDGWDLRVYNFGSISPNEASGIQVAANSYIGAMTAANGSSSAQMSLYSNTTFDSNNITDGYRAGNVTRIVTANTSRSITGTFGNTVVYYTYDWPTSGTIHCLVKF